MKKNYSFKWRFIIFIVAVFCITENLCADTIMIGTDPWCPYNCKDQENEGISIEVMRKIFEPEGHTVVVRYLPWVRAINYLKDGKITNFTSAAKADCPECLYADYPTAIMRNTIFVRKDDNLKWMGLNSLNGKILGVIKDYTYGDELTDYIKKYADDPERIRTSHGEEALSSNLKMLVAGRIDLAIDEEAVLLYTAKKLGLADRIKPVHVVSAVPLYLGFSPKDPKGKYYRDLASSRLKEMKENGALDKLYAKYGLKCPVCD